MESWLCFLGTFEGPLESPTLNLSYQSSFEQGDTCTLTSSCSLSPISLVVQSTQLIDFWMVTVHLRWGSPWETFKTVPGQLSLSRFDPWKTLTHFLPQYQPMRCVITSQMQLSASPLSLSCYGPSCFLRYPCKVYTNRREHIRLSDWSHWGSSSLGLEVKWQPPPAFPLGVMGQGRAERTTSSQKILSTKRFCSMSCPVSLFHFILSLYYHKFEVSLLIIGKLKQ